MLNGPEQRQFVGHHGRSEVGGLGLCYRGHVLSTQRVIGVNTKVCSPGIVCGSERGYDVWGWDQRLMDGRRSRFGYREAWRHRGSRIWVGKEMHAPACKYSRVCQVIPSDGDRNRIIGQHLRWYCVRRQVETGDGRFSLWFWWFIYSAEYHLFGVPGIRG